MTVISQTIPVTASSPMIPMPVIATFLTPIVAVVAGQVLGQATAASGNDTVGLISSGGAVAVLGGVLTWILTKTVPQMQEAFRQTIKELRDDYQREAAALREQFAREAASQRETFAREMAAQREAQDRYNDRLIRWLGSRADLPSYNGETPQKV
jgi:membrane protein YqaA with SNARE-associated domain